MKCIIGEPLRARDGSWSLTLTGLPSEILQTVDSLSGKDTEVEFKVHREKRSLDANAYFHLLVNKIAKAVNSGDDDVKRELVIQYGALERDNDGKLIGIMLPVEMDPVKVYPYCRRYGDCWTGGRAFAKYLIYKRTHEMNTEEFTHLIDGTIQDAQDLGIETITPAEKQRMMESYERRYGKRMEDAEIFTGFTL